MDRPIEEAKGGEGGCWRKRTITQARRENIAWCSVVW